MASFINAHTHAEWFGGPCAAQGDGMIPWIRRVLALSPTDAERDTGIKLCGQMMRRQSVSLIGDYGRFKSAVESGLIEGRHYRELLRDDKPDAESIAIHSVHTVLREVIARVNPKTFLSVHAGESREEMELYRSGSGPMADLLLERGFPREHVESLKGTSPVKVLDEFGLLSARMQVVHAVHLSDEDFELIAARGAHIVLCPVSNRDIGTISAREASHAIRKMLNLGISLAIGTDSPLSATVVTMAANTKMLHEYGVPRPQIEKMLTNSKAIGW